ncbi:MAG: hypothetical protein ACOC1F_10310 [Myxococcota bacterium]
MGSRILSHDTRHTQHRILVVHKTLTVEPQVVGTLKRVGVSRFDIDVLCDMAVRETRAARKLKKVEKIRDEWRDALASDRVTDEALRPLLEKLDGVLNGRP